MMQELARKRVRELPMRREKLVRFMSGRSVCAKSVTSYDESSCHERAES